MPSMNRRQPRTTPSAWGTGLLLALLISVSADAETWRDTFDDPFAYCAALDTVDAPGRRYVGPPMTPAIARGLQQAFAIEADQIPESLLLNSVWRCMDGQVYACNRGANLPCETRADLDREPTPALTAYCVEHPQTDSVPMAVSGRATVYAWHCEDGVAVAGEQFVEPDARGYLQSLWFRIPSPGPAPGRDAPGLPTLSPQPPTSVTP